MEPFLLEYLQGLNFDSPLVQANPSDCKAILLKKKNVNPIINFFYVSLFTYSCIY